jgi:hypothetical protein
VRVVHRVGRLLHDACDEAEIERALLAREAAKKRQQGDALEVLHDDVELAIGLA